jgi:putative phage-type endonuclease
MSAIVQLQQGSPEWLEHRKRYRNASETPAVLGVSPWVTPYQLWMLRTGRAKASVNAAMARGSELEPAARAAYEALTGLVMQPLVLVDGQYSASLDGMTLDGSLILEIKCPVKGQASELWARVQAGELPEHYAWQVEHQLMVSGAARAHVYVFDGANGVLLERLPAPSRWARIQAAWDEFMRLVESDTAPLLTDRDTLERSDQAWREAADRFLIAKERCEQSGFELEDAKKALVGLAGHPREQGAGVSVTRYWKTGPVEYKRIPALAGVDLELYRGASREEVRITVTK